MDMRIVYGVCLIQDVSEGAEVSARLCPYLKLHCSTGLLGDLTDSNVVDLGKPS